MSAAINSPQNSPCVRARVRTFSFHLIDSQKAERAKTELVSAISCLRRRGTFGVHNFREHPPLSSSCPISLSPSLAWTVQFYSYALYCTFIRFNSRVRVRIFHSFCEIFPHYRTLRSRFPAIMDSARLCYRVSDTSSSRSSNRSGRRRLLLHRRRRRTEARSREYLFSIYLD